MTTDPAPFTILLMGVLEGLTEFLPVSSTGHLILAGELLGYSGEASKTFKVAVQLGAILAVLVAYRERFAEAGLGLARQDPRPRLFVRNILIGFLPAIVLGVLFYDAVRAMLSSPLVVAVALVAGGIVMLILDRRLVGHEYTEIEAIPVRAALAVGALQCLAMIPGVSRSGASILGALAIGVRRKAAAEFSFFLAIPTMTGATAYDLYRVRATLGFEQAGDILLGGGAAFLTALLVVKAFVAVVSRHGFAPFCWYRIGLGLAVLVWFVASGMA